MTTLALDDRVKHRLKLRDLNVLMAVVHAGSMGKAATHVGLSQPAVSKAIADLEHAVGARLLDRSRQGIEPTAYGRALVARGVAVFDELRQGVQDIAFLSDPTAGELRIGTTEPIAAAIVAPVIDRFARQYPRMAFHVIAGDTATLLRELAERNVDLVLSRMTGPVSREHTTEILFDDILVVATGAKNPLTRRRRIALAELMDEPWTLSPAESYFGSLQAVAFRGSGLDLPRPTVSTSSPSLRNELLATGRFLSVLTGFSLRLPRRSPWLKALPVDLSHTRMPIAVIALKNRSLNPLAQLFIERIRAITKPMAANE